MKRKLVTTKISEEALAMLRTIAAKTDEKYFVIMERVLGKELQKIERREQKA